MATPVYPNMAPAAQDTLQELLVKAVYWAQSAAGAGPFPSGMYTNMAPFAQDTVHDLVAKLAYWASQIAGGGGGGGSLVFSSGAGANPNGAVSGSPGDTYYSDPSLGGTGTLWTKVSGTATTSGWVV